MFLIFLICTISITSEQLYSCELLNGKSACWKNEVNYISNSNKNGIYPKSKNVRNMAGFDVIFGSRSNYCLYSDSNGFYIFGGFGLDNGTNVVPSHLNDLWYYDYKDLSLIWLTGSSIGNQFSNYNSDIIGGREKSVEFRTSADLYVFGGFGYSVSQLPLGTLGEFWRYNIITNQWNFMGGCNDTRQKTFCKTSQYPGQRYSAGSWSYNDKSFYMFGGYTENFYFGGINIKVELDDFWTYDITLAKWNRLGNGTMVDSYFGFGNIPSTSFNPANYPPSLYGTSTWIVRDMLYLFGGQGYNYYNGPGLMNDLYVYSISQQMWRFVCGSLNLNSYSNTIIPGGRYYSSSFVTENRHLWIFGGEGYATSTYGNLNDIWMFDIFTNKWKYTNIIQTGDSFINPAISDGNGRFIFDDVHKYNVYPNTRSQIKGINLNDNVLIFVGGRSGLSNYYQDIWSLTIETTCYGKYVSDSNVCNGLIHGTCVDTDQCICTSLYEGLQCEVLIKKRDKYIAETISVVIPSVISFIFFIFILISILVIFSISLYYCLIKCKKIKIQSDEIKSVENEKENENKKENHEKKKKKNKKETKKEEKDALKFKVTRLSFV